MKKYQYNTILYVGLLSLLLTLNACQKEKIPTDTEEAKPWVFWYWMHGAVTKEAITADLESLKDAGFGGAYVFSIREVRDSSFFAHPVTSMSPEWWGMIKHAMSEAYRLGLKMGMSACDGFTAAGGPWITPEMSMQKVVWADTVVNGNSVFSGKLPQPERIQNYYEDIAVYAFPAMEGASETSFKTKPLVSCSLKNTNIQYLAEEGNQKQFNSDDPCWIQYSFENAFTCRSVTIGTGWNNYQSNRLIVQVSNDGNDFRFHERLRPPRHGWEDLDANATQLIKPVTAHYFRFVYDPEGSEPGAEDLDDGKWEPGLKIQGIELSSETKIHQFEGKSGAIWRIAERVTDEVLPESDCVAKDHLLNITDKLTSDGELNWEVPAGKWVILRMGHTSTGHVNYIGGGGKGLECDKLNPEVVRFQFDQWFGEAFRQIGPDLANKVLKRFHVDSWECGSQNWSPVFLGEFQKKRGYELLPFLPIMAGVPIDNAELSEKVLADVRQTISELVVENFYAVMAEEAHAKGCLFSAESIAPVMVSDGMQHFREVDLPMNEFWFRSPSHDKPNDVLDAISGAHIYGKNIVQAESFTEIRLDFDETPALLKPLADRNFALGVNKLFYHVLTLNPWMDRKPGMTLDKVGNFLQRDQTWWKQGIAFNQYIANCQGILQQGKPVVDVAVFTGEETPRRALLPDRLIEVLPGILGRKRVAEEKIRLQNKEIPVHEMPRGISVQKNIAHPVDWVDPLRGYAYDSFNRDALLNLASVESGRIVLPGGASYALLVIPGDRKMAPEGGKLMSLEVAEKLLQLVREGATVQLVGKPEKVPGFDPSADEKLVTVIDELFSGEELVITDVSGNQMKCIKNGKGRVLIGPYVLNSFQELGLSRDFTVQEGEVDLARKMAWNHRSDGEREIYFVANQEERERDLKLRFRVKNKIPQIYNPQTNETIPCLDWQANDEFIEIPYLLDANESVFVIFSENAKDERIENVSNKQKLRVVQTLEGEWTLNFDPEFGGSSETIVFPKLIDWTMHSDDKIRFYSGTAKYTMSFKWDKTQEIEQSMWLRLGEIHDIAMVKVNGKDCGICWTSPYQCRIDHAMKAGENKLEIEVTNTWRNRLIGDHELPEEQRVSWTTAPYRFEGLPLLPAGLIGPVELLVTQKQ